MSAAAYSRLLDGFRAGWLSLAGHPFVLEFAAPQFHHPVDSSFGRRGCVYEYVGSACLPIEEKADSVFAWAIVRSEVDIAESIEEFKRLCSEAGAYLPAAIRDWVGDYHWSSNTDPASWWIAVLGRFFKIPGTKIDDPLCRPKLIDPWVMSLDVIEKLRLNTDSPRWPVDVPSGADRPASFYWESGDAAGRSESGTYDDEQSLDPDLEGLVTDSIRLGELRMLAAATKSPKAGAVALNDSEAAILQALLESGPLLGEDLAAKAGYNYNSHFKGTLSSLRKRGIIDNTRPGYSLTDWGRSLATKSGPSQD
jgi:hypothetical protein